jgi:hypothetical protein
MTKRLKTPRTHRHRYYGALAPNWPLRAAVTAMAMPAQQPPAHALPTCQPIVLPDVLPAQAGAGAAAARYASQHSPALASVPKRSPAHDLWDGCEADAQRGEDAQIRAILGLMRLSFLSVVGHTWAKLATRPADAANKPIINRKICGE